MKDRARSTLGYLAAFTLGMICMAVFTRFLLQNRAPSSTREPAPQDVGNDSPRPPGESTRRQTFQRMVRGPSAPPAEVPVEEVKEGIEGPPAEQEQVQIVTVPVPAIGEVRHVASHPARAAVVIPEAGRISGKVRLLNEAPPERRIALDPTCGAKWEKLKIPPFTRFYVKGKDRALADVVVSLVLQPDPGRGTVPQPLKISERDCLFDPYISAIQAGQSVVVENHDSILHNLHLTSGSNGEYNRALLPGRDAKFTLNQPEDFVRLKCDVHPWEFAYIAVFDHPFFAVSDRNGSFVISGVPPGRYTVQAVHRKAGTLRNEITLNPNRNVDVRFDFTAPSTETTFNSER